MKPYIILISTFLLAACGPQRGRLRIKGEYDNLPQADLLLYSPDGGISTVDTLHVVKGKFTYETSVDDNSESYTWVILYPNFHTLTFVARSGSDVRIKGDALSLGNEEVKGADSLVHETETRVPSPLAVGKKLPKSNIVKQTKGKWLLISFWANWKHGSSMVSYYTQQALQQYPDSLQALTYNLDVSPQKTSENVTDTLKWKTYCDYKGWSGPLLSKYGIRNIPFYILVDPKGKIAAMGGDYNRDIKSAMQKIGGVK